MKHSAPVVWVCEAGKPTLEMLALLPVLHGQIACNEWVIDKLMQLEHYYPLMCVT